MAQAYSCNPQLTTRCICIHVSTRVQFRFSPFAHTTQLIAVAWKTEVTTRATVLAVLAETTNPAKIGAVWPTATGLRAVRALSPFDSMRGTMRGYVCWRVAYVMCHYPMYTCKYTSTVPCRECWLLHVCVRPFLLCLLAPYSNVPAQPFVCVCV